jgi:hypothetical protein
MTARLALILASIASVGFVLMLLGDDVELPLSVTNLRQSLFVFGAATIACCAFVALVVFVCQPRKKRDEGNRKP